MDVVHIARAENGNYLVTYMLTKEEFEGLQAQAQDELDRLAQPETD